MKAKEGGKNYPNSTSHTEKFIDPLWTEEVQWDFKNTNFH